VNNEWTVKDCNLKNAKNMFLTTLGTIKKLIQEGDMNKALHRIDEMEKSLKRLDKINGTKQSDRKKDNQD